MTAPPASRRAVRFDRFGPPEVLELGTEPLPEPGPGDVVVAVAAVGVNFADTMTRRGEYRRDQVLPDVPGVEAVGTVVWAGPGSGHVVGTPVAAFLPDGGGYTDHAIVEGRRAYPVPGDVDPVTVAGAFLQGMTAWYAVDRYGRTRPGETVLVSGATGGVGGLAVQLAADVGARVIGTASTPEKRAEAVRLGCAEAVDPADPDLRGALREKVDVVVDVVGGAVFAAALDALAHNGRFVVVGSSTQQPATFDARRLIPRGQTVSGFVLRRVFEADPGEPARAIAHVLDRVAAGAVRLRTETFPLADAARVHTLLEERRSVGKIVLVP
ncbi:NADPH:quinone reductase [Pseudonocardia sulfidoxydans NBRC 16205]|uniref:NADPH:quinone reductase n=1 Tax=Pseudonocardia sulfidoxydans NBRC 16205 TaxID=1223511 RepID=A0A511DKK2_9PSEU|nr:zinc-binding dehydrogenase [Pseudonocardia sulfidoxydans]GEL25351.1 NADPH:quinone reductase [Pseudonocardia sulfidoxydans NBRC 16205]